MKTMKLTAALSLGIALLLAALPAAASTGESRLASGAGPVVLAEYSKIHDALAADRTAGVAEAAATLHSIAAKRIPAAGDADRPLFQAVADAAAKLTGEELAALRAPLKELSVAVDALLRAGGTQGWQLYYCPMADGYWIQTAEGVRNPYYGAAMLKCGDKVEGVAQP